MTSSWKKKLKITSSSPENWVLFFSKKIFVKQRKGGISCTPQPFLIVIYLQLSTKKTKKSVKSLFVHFLIRLANSSNVMAWWCWCQMMMTMKWKICVFLTSTTTWHETHIMPNLGVKMSFVPCHNMYFFVTMFSISLHVWGKHKVPISCLSYFTKNFIK